MKFSESYSPTVWWFTSTIFIIFSPSIIQRLVDLGEVHNRLTLVNLGLSLEKFSFVKSEVKVLGHLVSKQGIRLDPKKVESIQRLEPPKDVTKLKSFLGVINYFRKFIHKCSVLAEPLLLLTRG